MIRLRVTVPAGCAEERRYAIGVLLGDFLGLDHAIEPGGVRDVVIRADGAPADAACVSVSDVFFPLAERGWLSRESLPAVPLAAFDAGTLPLAAATVSNEVPILYGDGARPPLVIDGPRVALSVDVFGSAFFMLSRYEEAVAPAVADAHGRFPASASTAARLGFLDRPLIDEYVEILWACIAHAWPALERRRRAHRVVVSHDIDKPFRFAFASSYALARETLSALRGGRTTVRRACSDALTCLAVKRGRLDRDPFNTFDAIMDASEARGLRSEFYVIVRRRSPIDGDYDARSPQIRALLRRIHDRGHAIGLHASYASAGDAAMLAEEFAELRRLCEEEGIAQDEWRSRQHILRWRTPDSFRALDAAGLDADCTLGYADRAGFRCGVCRDFPTYDVGERRPLRLVERPLVAMEVTLLDPRYMGCDHDGARRVLAGLKRTCGVVDGDFSLLWHNSHLVDERDAAVYREAIGA